MISTTLLALAAAVQSPQGARQQATVVMPENARQRQMQEQWGYADAVVSNGSVHTDVNGQIEAMVKVKNRYMTGKAPAWTAVGTNGLLQPGGIAEITLVAHVPQKGAK
jgi:enamine deaminase RidA (YjgF/YER057c/UK114 family)